MKKDYIVKWLSENLTFERYMHTQGTAQMAVELAKRYGMDEEKAELAGLLHDCAKCYEIAELTKIISEKMPEIPPYELMNYKTFHAPVGKHLAQEIFEVEDREILNAIKYHTLGRVNMSPFEIIIFLADKIERNTRDENYTNSILKILDENEGEIGLRKALLVCYEGTIKSLVDRKLQICPTTIEVYNWLLS